MTDAYTMSVLLNKTIIIRIEPDATAVDMLERRCKESARWMNRVFRRLYTDKRNHGWINFGPNKDWGKKYGAIVRWKPKKKSWHVVGETLYPAFIRKDAPDRIDTPLKPESLQLLAQKVATAWGNFIGDAKKIPRPKGRIPVMGHLSLFKVLSKNFKFADDGFSMKIEGMDIHSARSTDPKYMARIRLIKDSVTRKTWSAVEVKKNQGKWYVHIPVAIEVPEPPNSPRRVMGVDVGIKNVMTTATIDNPIGPPIDTRIMPGLHIKERLEHIQKRIRYLRSHKDRGNRHVRRALKRLKGKRTRMQKSFMRQNAVAVVKSAVRSGAEAIAVEDLRRMKIRRLSKRLKRIVSNWARGESRDFIAFKAAEAGLNFVVVNPAYTSSICPACGNNDSKSRRRNESIYICNKCGYEDHDDVVGAYNTARRGWLTWNTPKSDNSRSPTSSPGAISGDSPQTGAVASRTPCTSRGADVIPESTPTPSNGGPDTTANQTIGLIGPSSTRIGEYLSGEWRLDRHSPSKQSDKIDKRPRASGEVTRGVPDGARTVKGTPRNGHLEPVNATGDWHPLGP